MLKALIFDVDGTLADTERDGHRPAFNLAFADAGLPWRWDERLYGDLLAVSGGRERIRHYLERFEPGRLAQPNIDSEIDSLHRAKNRHYQAIVADGRLPLRPGIAALIGLARAHRLRLAIATTTTLDNVIALLEHSLAPGSTAWFEVIGAGDVVPAKKPAPDIYRWVLERLALPASDCLAFEDSDNGLRAALGAGLPTVVTTNGYTRDQMFDGAACVLTQLPSEVSVLELTRWHAQR